MRKDMRKGKIVVDVRNGRRKGMSRRNG